MKEVLCLLFVSFLLSFVSSQRLDLHVDTDGAFSISFDGKAWLAGSEYMLDGSSSSDHSLVQVGTPTISEGEDVLGKFKATTLKWAHAGTSDIMMNTSFRTYPHDAGMIVFEQLFPREVENVFKGDSKDICRVVMNPFTLTSSVSGYNAYTPKTGGSGYDEHSTHYCDSNHIYAFHANINKTACQAKCDELKCGCFDVKPPGPPVGGSTRTIFPGFSRNTGPGDKLDCFSYHGTFPSMKACTVSSYAESGQGGAPLTIYDGSNTSLPMVVFSPLNYPLAHQMTSGNSVFGAGIKAPVTIIPAGWSQLFILSAGIGISDGMMAWGDRMLKYTGKPRADMYRDVTHSNIGFWTDNGGYYHYSTGTDKKKTYEEVLPKVKAYHDSIGVPFAHWQFDSWFYPKDGAVGPGGGGGAVTNWTAMKTVFPDGMVDIQKKLKVAMVMHNRQWSPVSDYIKHLPQFKWYSSKKAAVPEDPIAFFTWFFKQQEGWGLTMYEQDWMVTEYSDVEAMHTNISLADLWLTGMATGAASSNRTVQYCMPTPNEVLSGASHSSVTNARATGDYFHSSNQWAVGKTSLFYWPLGILPFKDGFYSSTNKQVGGQTVGPEKNPDREALMATLSCAMVGPMDGINLLNATRTMTTCRKDGRVLKPDRPVMTTDYCFRTGSPTCLIFHTYSDVKGLDRIHYHFNNDANPMTADMVYLKASDAYVVYNYYTGDVTKLKDSNPLKAGYEEHIYAIVSPITGAWAFIGEVDKYVTASTQRFTSITTSSTSLSANVVGVADETVKVCAVRISDMTTVCKSVSYTSTETKTIKFE